MKNEFIIYVQIFIVGSFVYESKIIYKYSYHYNQKLLLEAF